MHVCVGGISEGQVLSADAQNPLVVMSKKGLRCRCHSCRLCADAAADAPALCVASQKPGASYAEDLEKAVTAVSLKKTLRFLVLKIL